MVGKKGLKVVVVPGGAKPFISMGSGGGGRRYIGGGGIGRGGIRGLMRGDTVETKYH